MWARLLDETGCPVVSELELVKAREPRPMVPGRRDDGRR
jgi:hypothetical protein